MTPQEFLKIEEDQSATIEKAKHKIYKARELADKCPFPSNSRPAKADDIKQGAIIWHKDGDNGPFWNIVSEPLHYGDDFKAYVADDGCRYGLVGAFVDL